MIFKRVCRIKGVSIITNIISRIARETAGLNKTGKELPEGWEEKQQNVGL